MHFPKPSLLAIQLKGSVDQECHSFFKTLIVTARKQEFGGKKKSTRHHLQFLPLANLI